MGARVTSVAKFHAVVKEVAPLLLNGNALHYCQPVSVMIMTIIGVPVLGHARVTLVVRFHAVVKEVAPFLLNGNALHQRQPVLIMYMMIIGVPVNKVLLNNDDILTSKLNESRIAVY